jgi:hypothetical protein
MGTYTRSVTTPWTLKSEFGLDAICGKWRHPALTSNPIMRKSCEIRANITDIPLTMVRCTQVTQVVPIEIPAIREFLHQACRVERISGPPELQHHKAPDESVIERPHREHAEVVDVA